MINEIKEMINNTIRFLGTSAGITIVILLLIILILSLIIWLLIWILKNNFKKEKSIGGFSNVKVE